jgi:hypothetical protein
MRRTLATTIALAALLAAPQTANAKGFAAASVCGTNGCHRVDPAAVRTGFEDFAPAPTPPAEPFLTIRVRARVSSGRTAEVSRLDWLPDAGVTRASGDRLWTRPGPRLARALRHAARGLNPHHASELGAVDRRPPTARVVEVLSPADATRRHDDRPIAALAALAIILAALAAAPRPARAKRRPATPR